MSFGAALFVCVAAAWIGEWRDPECRWLPELLAKASEIAWRLGLRGLAARLMWASLREGR